MYDGYLLGAHDGNLSPLQSGDSIIPKFDVAPIPSVDAPVIDVEPQTDVEGFAVTVPTALLKQAGPAGADAIKSPTFTYTDVGGAKERRNDSDTTRDQYRLFEIPGAPHVAGAGDGCIGSSSFPTQYFTRAAAALLARWAEDGAAPPRAPRIELAKLVHFFESRGMTATAMRLAGCGRRTSTFPSPATRFTPVRHRHASSSARKRNSALTC